jgi:hypothetical protein
MGWECSTCGQKEKSIKGFWWRYLEEREGFEALDADGRIILK